MSPSPDVNKHRRSFWRSIQGQLVLVLLISLVPTLLIQAFVFNRWYETRRSDELQANLQIARAVAKTFEGFVSNVVQQEYAVGLALASFRLSHQEQKDWLEENKAIYAEFLNLLWVSPEGTVLISHLSEIEGQTIDDRKYFQEIVSGRDWSVSDLQHAKATGEPVIAIARGIRNNDGTLLGVVVASVTSDRLNDVLKIERPKGGGHAIVDSRGMLVSRFPWINATWEQRNWIKDYPEFKEAMNGNEISKTVFAPFEGKNRLVGFVPVASIGWAASAGRTEEIAMAAVVSQLYPQAMLLFMVTLTGFGTAFLCSRFIVNSVRQLRSHAYGLATGDASSPVAISGPAEIKEFAESFNEMAEKLKSREERLRESEERFRVAQELSPDGFTILRPVRDSEGVIVDFMWVYENATIARLNGTDPDQVIGRRLSEFFPGHASTPFHEIYKQVAETGETRVSEASYHGDTIQVQTWFRVAVIPTRSDIAVLAQDITERKQAEENVARLAAIVESSDDAIIGKTLEGKITSWNRAAEIIYGYTAEEAIGQSISILAPLNTPNEFPSILQKISRSEVVEHFDTLRRRKNGEVIGVSLSTSPIKDTSGKVIGASTIARDITVQKQMELEKETILELLSIINSSAETADLVKAASTFFQKQSGCEAVGIRLKEGVDFPYFEARGFPEEFVRMENSLCSRDADGNIIRDITGSPRIECMCGNVILERVDISKPFFSPGGSFWANSTTRLLAATTDADRQTRTRNRCNGEGYESVALIPLHIGKERLGLIQLNDKRQDMFSPEVIALWERLAGYLAVALSRSRVDTAFRESEAKLRAVFRALAQGIVLHNKEGKVVEINDSVERIHGHTLQELTDPHIDPGRRIIRPNGTPFPIDEQPAMVVLRTGEAVNDVEMGVTMTDGSLKWRLVNAQPVYDDFSNLLGAVASYIDITERKLLEEELRKSRDELEIRVLERTAELEKANEVVNAERKRFFDVLETLPVYVCLLTPDYHVPFVNRVFRERFRVSEGLRCFEHLFRRSEPCEICETYKVLETGSSQQWEWTGPDGRTYSVFDFPFNDTDGSSLILEMGIDITEQKQADAKIKLMVAKLEASNQALQDFASVASHDMKEPLRKVISFGNMLRRNYKESLGETGNGYLNRMIDASNRMQALITSILELSRATTSQEPFEEVDLYDLVQGVLSDLEVAIARSGADVQVGELPPVKADPTQMRQLFQNLIGNALKFNKDGEKPIVRINCTATDNANCQIVVEDNGIGFEDEYVEKIFAPFHRLHGRSSRYEGTGMGLAICKKIVERHGGTITAQSTPGKGSTFVIRLGAMKV